MNEFDILNMRTTDKVNLARFITRTGMYITIQDRNSIVSFIHGYELGTSKRYFTENIQKFISERYKIQQDSSGWAGQIEKLSFRLSLSWNVTFKKVALEILTKPSYTHIKESEILSELVKTRVESLIIRINKKGDPWFNKDWKDEWISYCNIKSKWFKEIWSEQELKIIKAINKEVLSNSTFRKKIPSETLIKQKAKFDLSR